MLTTYKTAEQKYLYETYANEEGSIDQEIVNKLVNMFSDEVWVRPENESDFVTSATHYEKEFLKQLLKSGIYAVKDGGDFWSVANALEYMFVLWDNKQVGRHLNSYLSFYCPFARICGRGKKVDF